MIRRALAAIVALPALAVAASGTQVHYVMGTWLRIVAHGAPAAAAQADCFQEVRRLEHVFSRFDPTSELTRVNASAERQMTLGPEMTALLRRSLLLTQATEGAFDATIGALTAVWRDEPGADAGRIAEARAHAGSARVRLDGSRLERAPGTRLDFDGIAKGWAVDECVARLRAAGVSRALVSLGESSLYALGAPDGEPGWRFAVRGTDPETVVGRMTLRDAGASVSATYGSRGRTDGATSHIIDPATGRPVTRDAVALAVGPSATDAEAWTKAMLVWGRDGVDRVRALGASLAVYVEADGVEARGQGFEALPAARPLQAGEQPLR